MESEPRPWFLFFVPGLLGFAMYISQVTSGSLSPGLNLGQFGFLVNSLHSQHGSQETCLDCLVKLRVRTSTINSRHLPPASGMSIENTMNHKHFCSSHTVSFCCHGICI